MKTQESKPTNPYFQARRVWNDHVGQVVQATRTWQIMGMTSLVIAASSVFGLIAMAQRSQFIPYIVEVDKLGQVAAIQSASTIDETNLPNVIKAMLASFIARARMVTPDQMLQAKAIREVYAHLISSDPATGKMNDWFNGTKDSTPFAKSEKILVNAEITAILPQSAETWQIDWTENTVTRKGEPVSSVTMRALVTVYLVPPTRATTEAEIQKNPIGLFVKDFNWSKVGL